MIGLGDVTHLLKLTEELLSVIKEINQTSKEMLEVQKDVLDELKFQRTPNEKVYRA